MKGVYELMTKVTVLLRRKKGVTSIEYALIAGGIALAIFIAVNLVGEQLKNFFQKVTEIPW